jgi:LmbE family N-acetylglucosaminyl deacetylase
MLNLNLNARGNRPLHVLCLGAHCDDIEIGCGGTLLSLIKNNANIHIHWHLFTSTPTRKKEAIEGAELFCEGAASVDIEIRSFKDGFLPCEGTEVKNAMEDIKKSVTPDIIFTHNRNDLHQDHIKISDLTWNTFRNHFIIEYEIPKWDGDLGVPNLFVPIDQSLAKSKIAKIQQAYKTQKGKAWFTDDLFWSLMRIRGMECNSASSLAEGFYARKIQLDTLLN